MTEEKNGLLSPGEMLGPYQILRLLGAGGMGEVYLARHSMLNLARAVKVLKPEITKTDPLFAERFLREARISANFQHPNIVMVMDAGSDPQSGLQYMVMQYIDGCSVKNLLQTGLIPEDSALKIGAEVAKALCAAGKKNMVHRDIKPDNIMISKEGNVLLADMGIAKVEDSHGTGAVLTKQTVIGTMNYASPEQCRESHNVDARADIYSLGASLYEMLTGHLPFRGDSPMDTIMHVVSDPVPNPRDVNPRISGRTAALVMRMMAKDPSDRPADAEELLSYLNYEIANCRPFQGGNSKKVKYVYIKVQSSVAASASTSIAANLAARPDRKRNTVLRVLILALVLLSAALAFVVFQRGVQQTGTKPFVSEPHRNVTRSDAVRSYPSNWIPGPPGWHISWQDAVREARNRKVPILVFCADSENSMISEKLEREVFGSGFSAKEGRKFALLYLRLPIAGKTLPADQLEYNRKTRLDLGLGYRVPLTAVATPDGVIEGRRILGNGPKLEYLQELENFRNSVK